MANRQGRILDRRYFCPIGRSPEPLNYPQTDQTNNSPRRPPAASHLPSKEKAKASISPREGFANELPVGGQLHS
ncbi:hypothetical protein [Chamaesiphon sp. OTE_75_metabat_556]|uniref:hypothetical protein n=1 Tax=Chamaesiphon sp. OTE_75_metabat_556 TaxID=2964692 RepID=UPI00286C845F|nr:hypothetical protein [Chamaesiphon sp. OTE_75_metabat_556]